MSVFVSPENDWIQTAEFGDIRRDVYERIMKERQQQPEQPRRVSGAPAEPVRRCPLSHFAECRKDRCALYNAKYARCIVCTLSDRLPAEADTAGKQCPITSGLRCNSQCVLYNGGCTIQNFQKIRFQNIEFESEGLKNE